MNVPRFSIRTLIALVTLAAVGCAALANPTDLWASAVFSGTLLILAAALLAAIARRSVGAVGFIACGAAYLGLILAPGAETNVVPHLLTSKGLVELEKSWHPPPQPTSVPANAPTVIPPGQGPFFASFTNDIFATWGSRFQRIGHCLFALLFAAVGGLLAAWLCARKQKAAH
jgi:hypothetical protein